MEQSTTDPRLTAAAAAVRQKATPAAARPDPGGDVDLSSEGTPGTAAADPRLAAAAAHIAAKAHPIAPLSSATTLNTQAPEVPRSSTAADPFEAVRSGASVEAPKRTKLGDAMARAGIQNPVFGPAGVMLAPMARGLTRLAGGAGAGFARLAAALPTDLTEGVAPAGSRPTPQESPEAPRIRSATDRLAEAMGAPGAGNSATERGLELAGNVAAGAVPFAAGPAAGLAAFGMNAAGAPESNTLTEAGKLLQQHAQPGSKSFDAALVAQQMGKDPATAAAADLLLNLGMELGTKAAMGGGGKLADLVHGPVVTPASGASLHADLNNRSARSFLEQLRTSGGTLDVDHAEPPRTFVDTKDDPTGAAAADIANRLATQRGTPRLEADVAAPPPTQPAEIPTSPAARAAQRIRAETAAILEQRKAAAGAAPLHPPEGQAAGNGPATPSPINASESAAGALSTAPTAILEGTQESPSHSSERVVSPSETNRTGLPSSTTIRSTTDESSPGDAKSFALGSIDPTSNRKVLQPTSDVNALLALSDQTVPKLRQDLHDVTSDLEGAHVYGARAKHRDPVTGELSTSGVARLHDKIAERGGQAHAISDYVGGRVWVDDLEHANTVVRRLEQRGYRVIEDENFLNGQGKDRSGYRARHMQLEAPSGMSVELQIQPRGVGEVQEPTHVLYNVLRSSSAPRAIVHQLDAEARRMFEEVATQAHDVPHTPVTLPEVHQAVGPFPQHTGDHAVDASNAIDYVHRFEAWYRKRVGLPEGAPALEGATGGRDVTTIGKRRLAVRYRAIEAPTLIPSNDPHNGFAPHPDYPQSIQGRVYHGEAGLGARERVVEMAGKLSPDKLTVQSRSANGPPVVTRRGHVIVGNQRTMAQQLAYASGRGDAIRSQVLADGERLGLDPSELERMQHPVIVREITDPAIGPDHHEQLAEINQLSDIGGGKAKDPMLEAAGRARQVQRHPEVLEHLADSIGPDETIADYLRSPRGPELLDRMVKAEVIQPNELDSYRDAGTGKLTKFGRDRIAEIVQSAAVSGDVALLDNAPPAILGKLEQSWPKLVQAGNVDGWSLEDPLREALELHTKRVDNGMRSIADVLGQGDMFGGAAASESRGVQLAKFLERSKKGDVTAALERYATAAQEAKAGAAADDMFGHTPETPDQAFARAFAEKPAAPAPKVEEPATVQSRAKARQAKRRTGAIGDQPTERERGQMVREALGDLSRPVTFDHGNVAPGSPLSYNKRVTTTSYVVHRSAREPGRIQVTELHNGKPFDHDTYDTPEEVTRRLQGLVGIRAVRAAEQDAAGRFGQIGADGTLGVKMMGSISGAGIGAAGGARAGNVGATPEERRRNRILGAAAGALAGAALPWAPEAIGKVFAENPELVSDEGANIFKLSHEEGRLRLTIAGKPDVAQWSELMDALRQGGKSFRFSLRRPDGTPISGGSDPFTLMADLKLGHATARTGAVGTQPSELTPAAFKERIQAGIRSDATPGPDMFGEAAAHPLVSVQPAQRPGVIGYHGTNRQFDEFRQQGLGVHFGDEAQATERLNHHTKSNGAHHMVRADVEINNPLRMEDVGPWHDLSSVKEGLANAGGFTAEELRRVRSLPDARRLIQSKGYDGIVYRNRWEDPETNALARDLEENRDSYSDESYEAAEERMAAMREHGGKDSYIALDPKQIRVQERRRLGSIGDQPERKPALEFRKVTPLEGDPNRFHLKFVGDGENGAKRTILVDVTDKGDGTLQVNFIGRPSSVASDGTYLSRNEDLNQIGAAGMRDVGRALKQEFPGVQFLEGNRINGIRRDQGQPLVRRRIGAIGVQPTPPKIPQPPTAADEAFARASKSIDFTGRLAKAAGGAPRTLSSRIQRVMDGLANANGPLERLGELAGSSPHRDPGALLTYVKSSDGTAHEAIAGGGVLDPITRKPVAPSLSQIFEPIRGNDQDLERAITYLKAKRDLGRGSEGLGGDTAALDDAHTIVQFGDQDPTLKKIAQQWEQFTDGIGNYAVKSGLWTPKQWEAMKASDALYVRYKRIMDEGVDAAMGRGAGGRSLANVTSGVKSFKGSARAVSNPIEAMGEYARQIIHRSDRYRVGAAVFDALDDLGPEADLIGSPIRNTSELSKAGGAVLARAQAGAPNNVTEALQDLFTPQISKDNPVIWRNGANGRREYLQLHDASLWGALMQMNATDGAVRKFLNLTVRPLKRFFTSTTTGLVPRFSLVTNPLRDIPVAMAQSQASLTPADIMKGYAEASASLIGRSELATEAQRFGLAHVSIFSQDLPHSTRSVAPIGTSARVGTVARRVVGAPVHGLEALGNASDLGPRLGEYMAAVKQNMKKVDAGEWTLEEARLDAARKGRGVTLDFSNQPGNAVLRLFGDYIPFFRVGLQGPTKFAQSAMANPKRVGSVAAAAGGAAAMAWFLKHQLPEEERQKIDDMDASTRSGYLFVPTSPGGPTLKIPVAQELNVFVQGMTAALDGLYETNAHAGRLLAETGKRLLPSGMDAMMEGVIPVPGIQQLEENARNQKVFGNRAVEPRRMADLPPASRRLDTTSPTYDAIAAAVRMQGRVTGMGKNTSPLQAENVVRGVTSTATPLITAATDPIASRLMGRTRKPTIGQGAARNPLSPSSAILASDQPAATESERDYYAIKDKLVEGKAEQARIAKTKDRDALPALRDSYGQMLRGPNAELVKDTDTRLTALRDRGDAVRRQFQAGAIDEGTARTQLDQLTTLRQRLVRRAVSTLRARGVTP